jgi:hypothetical protein
MICPACSCENDPQTVSCASCSARLAPELIAPRNEKPAKDRSHAEQIADLDQQIAELTQRLHAAHAIRAAIGDVHPRGGGPHAPAERDAAPPAIDVGALRLTLGGPHGAQLDPSVPWDGDDGPRAFGQSWDAALPTDLRPKVTAAVWEAFSSGAPAVRVDAKPGAGATTLLRRLAASARDRGFPDGALMLSDVRGPASDVAQRLAALFAAGERPRYHTEPERSQAFGSVRALILLDRAKLPAADEDQLVGWFSQSRFVIVGTTMRAAVPTFALGPLAGTDAIAVLEAGFGRTIEPDDRSIALDLCTPIGPFPGPTCLVGVAFRELRRSLISLRLQFDSGADVIREFIRQLPPTDQRTLTIMALARLPLRADQLAAIAGHDVQSSLERLAADELVRRGPAEVYELPSYVAGLVAPAADADALFARLIEVVGGAVNSRLSRPVLDRQLVVAETVLHAAAERALHAGVLLVGPRLADAFARRGVFGAWGRVLRLVETAATRAGDAAALDRTRHELGVRALLLGEFEEATTCLRSAARGRKTAGDGSGAAASAGVLALADFPLPAKAGPGQASDAVSARPGRALGTRTLLLVLLGLFCVAVAISALSIRRPLRASPPSVQLSVTPNAVTPGGPAAQLCAQAQNAAVVEIFPDGGRLPGAGRNCVNVHPAATTTYVAVGTASDGRRARAAATVLVQTTGPGRPLHIMAFSARPARIAAGGSTRLCYAVSGADVLRIVPRIGELTRLRACHTLRLRDPHRYVYKLAATGDGGQFAVRSAQVEVVPRSPVRGHPPVAHRSVARASAAEQATRRAIFQFDATPSVVERGQAASLCVGIDRPARGYVTHVGPLQPGITRCYRVLPHATTVYRLYIAIQAADTVQTVTVEVRPPARRREVARSSERR